MALAGDYGYHRDELYFLSCGRHLAWGFPDQGPLVPAIAHLMDELAPTSVAALRLPSALVAGCLVIVGALTARQLGGARSAQLLAAFTTASSTVVLGAGHLLSTVIFDVLSWTLVLFFVLRGLDGHCRAWLLAGVAAGVGLLNKDLPAFLLVAVFTAMLTTRSGRNHLNTVWPWAGGIVAFVLCAPNLVWQAKHGWPQLAVAADIRAEYLTVSERLNFVLLLALLGSPFGAYLIGLGLVFLWRSAPQPAGRLLVATTGMTVGIFFVSGGKGYYVAGLVPTLLAAGSVAIERSQRGVRAWIPTVVGLSALLAAPVVLPLMPARTLYQSPWGGPAEDQLETVGWQAVSDAVDTAYRSLPPPQRHRAIVFAENYGEAGALQELAHFGVHLRIYSGHNAFAEWGPPPLGAGPVIVIAKTWIPEFKRCRLVARVNNGLGVANEEQMVPVRVCAPPPDGWTNAWPRLGHYGG